MRALLDINVLIALLDSAHSQHSTAANWLATGIPQGWASCPITENGVVRIMSQPAYPNPQPAVAVAERLAEASAGSDHRFWPDNVSLLTDGLIHWAQLLGHGQITDAYLLALAIRHGGRFVTFDQRINEQLVKLARPEHLCVIAIR